MDIKGSDVEKAGLLHDIGKIFQRAEQSRDTHSVIGERTLRPFFHHQDNPILTAVSHHHKKALEKETLPADDISYIIYEADNLASALDRRSAGKKYGMKFDGTLPLCNLFNIFNREGTTDYSAYAVQSIDAEKRPLPYPAPQKTIHNTPPHYQEVGRQLTQAFTELSPEDMTVSELLQLLEKTTTYIPSSTDLQEIPDISLYDHQKLTAALAVCIWHYLNDHNLHDYASCCYGTQQDMMRKVPMYLMVSGDISGIQKFIYTIPSKGALKSLRGRSLYLDILLEDIVDEILTACDVSRTCLLYTGGGHFYMILPNTQHVKDVLAAFSSQLDEWFLHYYGTQLYMALAYTECSAMDFSIDGIGAGKVFQQVSRELGKAKLCRYEESQLEQLFDPQSVYNKVIDAERECAICHTSTKRLRPYGDGETEAEACDTCNALYQLGQDSLQQDIFFVSETAFKDSLPLPGYGKKLFLKITSQKDAAHLGKACRIYLKNGWMLHEDIVTHLWMGDYITKSSAGHPVEFTELAAESGGSKEAASIERIGILRADVDNLGAAFIAGFAHQYDTLSRKAALSRSLSLFFKHYINEICSGHTADPGKKFTLFQDENKEKRKLHIIYSGGDDMFLAGAWDDILEVAVDLRHAFRQFTNGKLTFSAGVGFFQPTCPISQMARKTGELEDYAKGNPTKNSIALFGNINDYTGGQEISLTMRYDWDTFEKDVCGEKLHFLETHFNIGTEVDATKLTVGKGLLYRILDLLRAPGSLNLARLAYLLGRLEPDKKHAQQHPCYDEIRNRLYEWSKEEKHRRALMTAIELLIYHKRDKEGENNEK